MVSVTIILFILVEVGIAAGVSFTSNDLNENAEKFVDIGFM